jgi:GH24 family phage-related lysozyme (muramidase)
MVPSMAYMEQIISLAPWAVVLIIYVGEKIQQVIQARALNAALQRAQGAVHSTIVAAPVLAPIPAPPPVAHPAAAPVTTPQPPISTQPVDVVDQGLVNFIKKTEGLSLKAYWDYKQYSIGYGTKATSATEVITEAEAVARLTVEIDKAEKLAEKVIPAGAPIGVKQALTDLTYNAGSGWEEAGLGTAVKASDWAKAKESILQYNHAGGVVNAGLTARREAEVSWFDSPL